MGRWSKSMRAGAHASFATDPVPIVPIAPTAPRNRPIGTNGTNGTWHRSRHQAIWSEYHRQLAYGRDACLAYSFAVEVALAMENAPQTLPDGPESIIAQGTERKRQGVKIVRRSGLEPPKDWRLPDGNAP